MNRRQKASILVIDFAAGGLCAALLGAFVWFAFFRGDQTGVEVRELGETVAAGRGELTSLRGALDQQRTLLQQRQAELSAGGRLPDGTPIEDLLQTLSHLAAGVGLNVVRHHPLPPRNYPGLLEQRYAYEVSGSMPDIARFLKAVEEARFWADVSYLRVDSGRSRGDTEPNARVASLTISVFSSLRGDGSDRG